jgi:hypothetical protein
MARNHGKLRLVLRSRKVVARMARVETPVSSLAYPHGRTHTASRLVPVFDYEFEEDQLRALTEWRELAERTGLSLEVTDLTRQGPLKQLVMRLGGLSEAALSPAGMEVPHAVETLNLRRGP